MNIKNIRLALVEAKKFISIASDVIIDENSKRKDSDNENFETYYLSGSKLTGACRRASMDLTRALANMRKNG
jgi:hypothetical protein